MNHKHLRAGVSVQRPGEGTKYDRKKTYDITRLIGYLVNYVKSKDKKDKSYQEELPYGFESFGRWWGVSNRSNVKWVYIKTRQIDYWEWYQLQGRLVDEMEKSYRFISDTIIYHFNEAESFLYVTEGINKNYWKRSLMMISHFKKPVDKLLNIC